MQKESKQLWRILLLNILTALVAAIFIAPIVSARLSQVGWLRKLHWFNPQAPIVINTKEQIRVSDAGDPMMAFSKIQPKLSLLVAYNDKRLQVFSGAVNLTADGWLVAAKVPALASKNLNLAVADNLGKTAKVEQIVLDPASNLAFLKIRGGLLSIAALASSKEAKDGQQATVANPALGPGGFDFFSSFISRAQADFSSGVYSSDRPGRTFILQKLDSLTPGAIALNSSGEILGLWDGSSWVSADVLRSSIDLLFSHKLELPRLNLGFHYRNISLAENQLLSLPKGVIVAKTSDNQPGVIPASPASLAGLREGDVIVSVFGKDVDKPGALEELLEKYKPGDKIVMQIQRAGQKLELSLLAGSLK